MSPSVSEIPCLSTRLCRGSMSSHYFNLFLTTKGTKIYREQSYLKAFVEDNVLILVVFLVVACMLINTDTHYEWLERPTVILTLCFFHSIFEIQMTMSSDDCMLSKVSKNLQFHFISLLI